MLALAAGVCMLSSELAAQSAPFGASNLKRPDAVLVVHAGRLLAIPGRAVAEQQTIVIRNDRVTEILEGFADPVSIERDEETQLTVLDLRNHFVLPGLMDAHVHLARATGAYQPGMMQINANVGEGEATVNAMINARLNLAAGFTAVRDLGSDQKSVFAARDAIESGFVLGPTIIASGISISVTGGHGDNAVDQTPDERAAAGVCDGVAECGRLVRHLEKTGSDVIKFKATGGFSSNTGLKQHMSAAEMGAIVDAARLRNIRVTTHAYDPLAIIDAINAGVNSVEHAFLLDDKGIRMMRKQGVYLVPTLTVAEPPAMVKRFMRGKTPISVELRNQHQAFEKAYAAGVKIAFGTDVGIYPHGKNADEFATMVGLGMTPEDAIVSATINTAGLFDMEGLTGTIEPGARADFIAVSGDPLVDVAALADVDYVIKSGRVAKRAGTMQPALDFTLKHRY